MKTKAKKKKRLSGKAFIDFMKRARAKKAGKPPKKKAAKKKRIVKVKRKALPSESRGKGPKKPGKTRKRKGVKTMAKKRKSVGSKARRARRRVGAAMASKPGKFLAYGAEAAAGAVVSSLAVNKLPIIRDQSRGLKVAAQGGLGLLAVMFVRNRHVKSLGAGAVIASIMGAVREFVKVEPLAGPSAGSRTLTAEEMRQITSGQMNMPLPGQQMGVPLGSAPRNAGFGRAGFGS